MRALDELVSKFCNFSSLPLNTYVFTYDHCVGFFRTPVLPGKHNKILQLCCRLRCFSISSISKPCSFAQKSESKVVLMVHSRSGL